MSLSDYAVTICFLLNYIISCVTTCVTKCVTPFCPPKLDSNSTNIAVNLVTIKVTSADQMPTHILSWQRVIAKLDDGDRSESLNEMCPADGNGEARFLESETPERKVELRPSIDVKKDQGNSANLAAALALANIGICIFPAKPDKTPYLKDWKHKATTDRNRIEGWWTEHPDAMPAMPTGEINGLSALDLDVRDDGRDGLAALDGLGLALPDAFAVATPSGGKHLIFAHRAGVTNARAHLPKGVDVRGDGGYIIAAGATLPDGRRYAPDSDLVNLTPESLPRFPRALLPPARDDHPALTTSSDFAPSDVESILGELGAKSEWRDDREGWVKVGMALHDWSGGSGEGRDLWDGFSQDSKHYNTKEIRDQWRSFGSRSASLSPSPHSPFSPRNGFGGVIRMKRLHC